MKPVFQTIFGIGKGNCLQAVLASIFEVELNVIPNFAEYGDRFYPEFWKWQKENNLHIEYLKFPPVGICPMSVKSPRYDCYHAMVAFDGNPIHDPFPGGNCEYRGEPTYGWITLIDPSKPIGLLEPIKRLEPRDV